MVALVAGVAVATTHAGWFCAVVVVVVVVLSVGVLLLLRLGVLVKHEDVLNEIADLQHVVLSYLVRVEWSQRYTTKNQNQNQIRFHIFHSKIKTLPKSTFERMFIHLIKFYLLLLLLLLLLKLYVLV